MSDYSFPLDLSSSPAPSDHRPPSLFASDVPVTLAELAVGSSEFLDDGSSDDSTEDWQYVDYLLKEKVAMISSQLESCQRELKGKYGSDSEMVGMMNSMNDCMAEIGLHVLQQSEHFESMCENMRNAQIKAAHAEKLNEKLGEAELKLRRFEMKQKKDTEEYEQLEDRLEIVANRNRYLESKLEEKMEEIREKEEELEDINRKYKSESEELAQFKKKYQVFKMNKENQTRNLQIELKNELERAKHHGRSEYQMMFAEFREQVAKKEQQIESLKRERVQDKKEKEQIGLIYAKEIRQIKEDSNKKLKIEERKYKQLEMNVRNSTDKKIISGLVSQHFEDIYTRMRQLSDYSYLEAYSVNYTSFSPKDLRDSVVREEVLEFRNKIGNMRRAIDRNVAVLRKKDGMVEMRELETIPECPEALSQRTRAEISQTIKPTEDNCVICLEEIKTKQMDCGECSAKYHRHCIRKWLQEHDPACPTCRRSKSMCFDV